MNNTTTHEYKEFREVSPVTGRFLKSSKPQTFRVGQRLTVATAAAAKYVFNGMVIGFDPRLPLLHIQLESGSKVYVCPFTCQYPRIASVTCHLPPLSL